MTANERINTLLAQCGQTIEDLKEDHGDRHALQAINRFYEAEWNSYDTIEMGDEILHLADVIDRMEAALINVILDRDEWKRRAEAAERDLNAMLRAHVDDLHCDQCKKGGSRWVCGYYGSDMCPDAEWRGPCVENGDTDICRDNPL